MNIRKTGSAAVLALWVLGAASGCGGKSASSDGVQRLSVDQYNARVQQDMGKAMSAKPGK